jgi:tRNA threonylcarbamoyl adenosine modification protein YeaZ
MSGSPRILAFDTSAAHCAAALLIGDRIVASRHEEMGRGQAERLFPMLEEVLGAAGVVWEELDAIGVGVGPGNFTGIRIAVSAARGLALSLGIPAVGVSLFEQMRMEAGTASDIVVSLEAPRGQAYIQKFKSGKVEGEPYLIDPHSLDAVLDASEGALILGHEAGGIARSAKMSTAKSFPFVDASIAKPAERAARLAAERFASGGEIPRPAPLYIRPADAAPASDPPPVILP